MKQSKLNKISDCFGGPIDCKPSRFSKGKTRMLWNNISRDLLAT